MSLYEGVILAAGRNTRLAGIVPSYYKPLLIVQGKPLVVRLTQDLRSLCASVTVIVSPENSAPICDVLYANGLLDANTNIVVQPMARGPGEGLYRGLRCTRPGSRIILACGDNLIPRDDFLGAVEEDEGADGLTVTTCVSWTEDETEATRFTRVSELRNEFIENRPGGKLKTGGWNTWVGPLIFSRDNALLLFQDEVLRYKNGDPEIKISPVLNGLHPLKIRLVSGHSFDIGTSGALLEKVNGYN